MNQGEKKYGPTSHPQVTEKESLENESLNEKNCGNKNEATYGPALPPHLQKLRKPEACSIGPTIPPHVREKLQNISESGSPEELSEDEIYGPVLPGTETKSRVQLALEERALEMKLNQLNPEEEKVHREEWMMELPTVSANKLGLGARQFRRNAAPDMSDRSSWTNIPGTKTKEKETESLKEEVQNSELRRRNKYQEKMARSHKRESQSLLEIHRKKRKQEKSDVPKERIPFNKETDLQVKRFDEVQKAAVLKKAQLLDDRFSQGKSKFL